MKQKNEGARLLFSVAIHSAYLVDLSILHMDDVQQDTNYFIEYDQLSRTSNHTVI